MNIGRRNQTYLAVVFTVFALMILAFTLGCRPVAQTEKPAIRFAAPHQAVLLSNNPMYFGKLSVYRTSNPVLPEVYYTFSKPDPTTQQVQDVLLMHGKELPGPDRMTLNADSIIFVEPVSTDPKVSQLIQKRISRSSLDDHARGSRHEAASR